MDRLWKVTALSLINGVLRINICLYAVSSVDESFCLTPTLRPCEFSTLLEQLYIFLKFSALRLAKLSDPGVFFMVFLADAHVLALGTTCSNYKYQGFISGEH